MSPTFWIILLIILMCITLGVSIGIVVFNRIVYKYKNGLVVRIHMVDKTIKSYRYHEIPPDNKATITELDNKGKERKHVYLLLEECIEKGTWGRYIDFNYKNSIPINPSDRSVTKFTEEFTEFFKHVGALLDTDLHVKLLRSNEFESFVRTMLTIILIGVVIIGAVSTVTMVKSFTTKSVKNSGCVLQLDNQTWRTIYVASHSTPPSMIPTQPSG